MERDSRNSSTGSLPLVISLTTLVLVVPCLAAIGLRATGLLTSPVLLILIPVGLSVLFSHSISELWKRRRAGSPLLFEDLMLWGWLRRRRFEKLLARSEEFVGPGAGEGLTPKQRARELERLAGALEARDPRTHGHSRRVARHALSIARGMKLPEDEVARIRTAALLHDIGKIEVPWEILEKPGALTDQEFAEIKKHPEAGARLVEGMGDPQLTAIVMHHHERIDGGGYPSRIAGEEIPVGARIIAVADTFDALTSARSYRQPRSHEEALGVLREEAGSQLDGDAVRAFDGRYASRRPIALVATVLGVGRQAGQSMISFGTGASQVAAVGAAAAVIGVAPAVERDVQPKAPGQPAVVREASTATGADEGETVAGTTPSQQAAEKAGRKKPRDRSGRAGGEKGTDLQRGDGKAGDEDAGTSSGNGGNNNGGSGGSSGGTDSGGSGSSGGGSGGQTNPVTAVTENVQKTVQTVQKPVQQVTEQVTQAIPTLPGNDPVSKGVNDTVNGVKDTIGKLTGKP